MSMPDNLTIYKVPFGCFGEDGYLLSFMAPFQGCVEETDYIKMSSYNAEVWHLEYRVNELIDEVHQLKEEKLSLKDEVARLNDEREALFNRIECLDYRLNELEY